MFTAIFYFHCVFLSFHLFILLDLSGFVVILLLDMSVDYLRIIFSRLYFMPLCCLFRVFLHKLHTRPCHGVLLTMGSYCHFQETGKADKIGTNIKGAWEVRKQMRDS